MYRHPHGDDLLYIVWLKLGMQHAGCSEIRITEGPVRGAAWTDKRPYDKRVMKKACEDNLDPQFFGTFR